MTAQLTPLTSIRKTIRNYTHADEKMCVDELLAASYLTQAQRDAVVREGQALVKGCRDDIDKAGMLDVFMQEFSLSSKEGVALMCLAESLLRVPDAETADDLIAEKVLSGDWQDHIGQSDSLFVNASTWGLMLTGKMVRLDSAMTTDTDGWLKKLVNRLGEPVIRTAVRQAMKIMGQQYVLGRDINEAIKRGRKENRPGTRFSFDMLGEGARTERDAKKYYENYLNAIREIGSHEKNDNVIDANGISVKLSALHPRYTFAQKKRVMNELLPRVSQLAIEAKKFGLGFSIDAEEADRLDLSLDIFESLARDPELSGWNGLGFVLQAYGKRATRVADWLIALAHDTGRRFMVRLVKGAYWDSEIKYAQEQGYTDYPVYTRKANTDLSYQICAAKLLEASNVIYPQFATHNAYTAALISSMANSENTSFEFQRLHGMGDLLYGQIANKTNQSQPPVRVYAPVGAHKDLLPYLVRRLLENGANSSFVNRFIDNDVPVDQIIVDIQADVEKVNDRRHAVIPLPVDIYRAAGEMRPDTHGQDLANANIANRLTEKVNAVMNKQWVAGPIISGETNIDNGNPVVCPANTHKIVGHCRNASADEVERALQLADAAQPHWNTLGGKERAIVLERAAELMLAKMPELVGLISYEAGRTLDDAVSEVREAVDFLHYYALQARNMFVGSNKSIGPAGELVSTALRGRGVFFCISPWNFPLAIFTGQIAAALAAGNSVIAKPADPTPLIAAEAIRILLQAGVPGDVLHFMPGQGNLLGAILNTDKRVKGVAFTGSTQVAQAIQIALTDRQGVNAVSDIPALIAETGGQNVMFVDSSALPEQVVDDVIRSAFLSAGQRCSALRVMYVQEEVADNIIDMLKGAMDELVIGKPCQLDTDVGPVIDSKARYGLEQHIENMTNKATLLHACQLPDDSKEGTFVAPHLFELHSIEQLPGEIFGPILHVIRFKKSNLSKVVSEVNNTGFGLTLGVHSRIEVFAESVVRQTRVGNNYINRNMVGAVVGVNPFGGQGLSGTGPKAGGPHYLPRFAYSDTKPVCSESDLSEFTVDSSYSQVLNDKSNKNAIKSNDVFLNKTQLSQAYNTAKENQLTWDLLGGNGRAEILEGAVAAIEGSQKSHVLKEVASVCRYYAQQARIHCGQPIVLPGPTGETNRLSLHGRGMVYCSVAESENFHVFAEQIAAALVMGNSVIAQPSAKNKQLSLQFVEALLNAGLPPSMIYLTACFKEAPDIRQLVTADHRTAIVAWSGSIKETQLMQKQLAVRGGVITPVITGKGGPGYVLRFAVEKTVTTNIVATGGNALLLNLEE